MMQWYVKDIPTRPKKSTLSQRGDLKMSLGKNSPGKCGSGNLIWRDW